MRCVIADHKGLILVSWLQTLCKVKKKCKVQRYSKYTKMCIRIAMVYVFKTISKSDSS